MTAVAIVGTGFVARLVRDALHTAGVDAVMLHAPRVLADADTDLAQVRALHGGEIERLAGRLASVDVVINAAGIADASAAASAELFGANTALPAIVGLAAGAAGARRYVHVSSAAVQGRLPVLDESWRTQPFSPYSSSKALGERLAVAAAAGSTTVYRPPSVHAPDRRVTRSLARIARSPLSSVAGQGERPTPQALGTNVGEAIAHLALTPSQPPEVVAHPSEGLTTGELLRLLGDREPRRLPVALVRVILRVAHVLELLVPRARALTRRVEMIWLGQRQDARWLESDGWRPRTDAGLWRALATPVRGSATTPERAGGPSILFGVTTGIVVRSFFTGQFAMLREHGWDVTLVATHENGAESVAVSEGATFVPLTAVRAASPLRDLRTLLALVRELRRRRPDLAVWGTPKVGLLGTVASRVTGGRCVYVLHGLRLETAHGPSRMVLSMTERVAAWLADDVVAVGHDLRARAVAMGLVAPDKVRVLGHGSANGVVVTPAADGARSRLGLPESTVVVGFVGRVTRDKGVLELLQCWGEVHRRTGAHLALAGLKEPDAGVAPLATLLSTTPAVHDLGHQEDLADVYQSLDVLALPSHREGLPTVVLEAAAHGIPCVVTDATGVGEPLTDGVSGLVVPIGDVAALGEALVRLCEDDLLRQWMGRSAREEVACRYGRDVVHAQWLSFYDAKRPGRKVAHVS